MTDTPNDPYPQVQQPVVASHPYAKELEKNLQTQLNMLTLLESRLDCLARLTNYPVPEHDTKDKLEFFEYGISKIRTQGEIDVLKKVIAEKENYYKEWLAQFAKDEAECALKFKHTVAIAKKSSKPAVIKLLNEVHWERLEESPEHKVAFYKQLRKHV